MGELNLNTQSERDTIQIDGKPYEIYSAGELKYKDIAFFQHAAKRIQALITEMNDGDYTDEKAEELENLLHRAANLVLVDVPEEVFDKLTDAQRVQVVEYFSRAAERSGLSNPDEQSPDSSGTTEEPQENGSTPNTG